MRGTARAVVCGVLFVLACSGCYESRQAGTPIVTLMDGGTSVDAGTVISRPDSGRTTPDAGRASCTDPIREYEGPRCRPDTLDCFAACEGDACQECYERDLACQACVNTTMVACASRLGCEEAWERLACCAEASSCPSLDVMDVLACGSGACMAEVDALVVCVNELLGAGSGECDQEASLRCAP